MGKVEELSKSLIWHTTPMQQRSKSGFIRDWLSATAKGDKRPEDDRPGFKYQFPMGKVEELSKSLIWHTTPMQQRSKSGFIRDWLSATAKDDRYQCTFQNRTSIPYGKGKAGKLKSIESMKKVSIPYGKG